MSKPQWLNPNGSVPEIEYYNVLADFADRDEVRYLLAQAISRALTIPEEQVSIDVMQTGLLFFTERPTSLCPFSTFSSNWKAIPRSFIIAS